MNKKLSFPGSLVYRFYGTRLRKELQGKALPFHVAMIIDGNRRWAKQLGYNSTEEGYRAGAAKMKEFLGWCDDLGISVVTLYLLSNDNLVKRPGVELNGLLPIISTLAADLAAVPNWKIKHVGAVEALPEELANALIEAEEHTQANTGMLVNLAVGYGGRHEIVDAVRRVLKENAHTPVDQLAEELTPDMIAQQLYTRGQPDPDLVIRTSGEQRLSDFMLWQSAHSEFYFVEALGPDLREIDFLRALRDYASRERRYGS